MTSSEGFVSCYAPIRLRENFWWQAARKYANQGLIISNGLIRDPLHQLIKDELIDPSIEAISGFESPENMLPVINAISSLHLWVPLVGQYELCGRQIFDLSENLVEMLNNTDLGETTLEGWNAPYDAFYIRFGKQEEISALFDETGVSEYVDGAFIGLTPATMNFDSPRYKIKIAFTSVLSKGDPPLAPHHFIDFEPEELALPLERAVETALERHASFFNQGDATLDGIGKYRVDAMKEEYDLLLKGCTLLVNSLFYLESIGAHNKTSTAVPGRDTPPSLVVEWENKKPAQRRKLASKLTRDGYALVHLTGQEFDGPSISRKDGAKRVHWVRGHWRNQAIGQGRLERKRIWIKPHVSGTKGTIDEAPGHLYAVSGPNPDIKH